MRRYSVTGVYFFTGLFRYSTPAQKLAQKRAQKPAYGEARLALSSFLSSFLSKLLSRFLNNAFSEKEIKEIVANC